MYPVIMNKDWPIFKSLEARKAQLGPLSDLPAETLASMQDWFRTELTYTSNAIENNSLTRTETLVVLKDQLAIGGKPLKDHREAQNHAAAWDLVLDRAQNTESVTINDVLDIHRVILDGLDQRAGSFRTTQTFINGSTVAPPRAEEVQAHMDMLGQWLEHQPFDPATAFHAHLKLVDIHPFVDGNGRTGRLLTDLILMKGGYLPAIIQPEARFDYYEGIKSFCEDGKALSFASFMSDALEKTYDKIAETIGPVRQSTIKRFPHRAPK